MMRFLRSKKGFTLVELMIVVAIIGILAGIAIPRYMNFIRRSREGATKGNLGAVRSALNIYYSDTEGLFPSRGVTAVGNIVVGAGIMGSPFRGTGANNYLDEIKPATEACTNSAHATGAFPSQVRGNIMGGGGAGDGGWVYETGATITDMNSTSTARFYVDCNNFDSTKTSNVIISTW
ncbi:MAG: prepilin-type N-terminal cleavage/methylation domain-containing protein [bacterium]|nr:prepilin-type N-terminal cleavage/methylation domain-containing protein [bacterium]